MKVTVSATINYEYEVDIPETEDDIVGYCDLEDPVYREVCKIFQQHHIEQDGIINTIIDNDTDNILYNY